MALSEPQLAHKRLSELRTPAKPIILFKRFLKTRVDTDGDLLWSYSAQEGRLIFGRSSLIIYGVKQGEGLGVSRRGGGIRNSPSFLGLNSEGPELFRFPQSLKALRPV